MGFFERTPLGRILNRFSSDIASLDTIVPETSYQVVSNMTKVIASMIIMSFTTPYSIIVWILMAVMYLIVQVSLHILHLFVKDSVSQQTQNIGITLIQCWSNVEDVGPT